MRVSMSVAGLALVLAACGGEKKADEAPAAATPAAEAPAAAAAPAAGGTKHDVSMELVGSDYKFVPDVTTIKAGDVVVFHNKSGGPHNVQFYPDSIPAGAAAALDAAMKDRMGPVAGPLLAEPDATYEVAFAGAPAGEYKFYCLPHMAFKMKGKIVVQ
jgi:plastocyanin